MTAPIAVVHLVRAANGLKPFEAFMTSYEQHPAGAAHTLVLLLKGFEDIAPDLAAVRARARDHAPAEVRVGDKGFDLTAYLTAATCLPHETLCLLNSFSRLEAEGWLTALTVPLRDPATGATAATGSWGSTLEYGLWQMGLPGPYDCFGPRVPTGRHLHEVNAVRWPGAVGNWVANVRNVMHDAAAVSRFPAVHLRTNGLVIARSRLVDLITSTPTTKRATYHLESGRRGLTTRLRAQGLATLLVDRHGVARPPARWPEAEVFWQADQRDLLVSDNQTRTYAAATLPQREVLRRFAWGPQAREA